MMMKKMMLTAAVAFLMVPAMASAQSTVNATATVAQWSEVTGSGNLAFGTLSRTTDTTIDATDNSVVRTVSFNHDVAVSFTSVPTTLEGANSGYDLPVTLNCAVNTGSWSAAQTCGTATFNLDVGTGSTQATLGFGGTITAADTRAAVADTYNGTMTITVVAR